jgi:hypothetical protein
MLDEFGPADRVYPKTDENDETCVAFAAEVGG